VAPLLELPLIQVRGSPAELGRGQGEQLAQPIRTFVAQRLRAARVYLHERGIRDERAFLNLGRQCLEALQRFDADGWSEHQALSAAAGVDPVELYTCANMTDIRDILVFAGGTVSRQAEGCSMVLLPPASVTTHTVIAAQTWDLNPSDLDFVVAVHRQPSNAPQTWSITCAGCPSLIGMNEHGLSVGTTNLKTRGARVGVPYLSLLHRALACRTVDEAGEVFSASPRAAAHSFWAADSAGAADWECTATTSVRRQATTPLVRTNHCLESDHQAIEGEAPSSSSRARLARLKAWAAQGARDADSLRVLFANRDDGVDSINRYPEDAQGTSTNACVVCLPAQRTMWTCRGSADRGRWVTLGFDRG
jgi:isopenicillin-N N-acyltransferase-like protein